MPTGEIGVAGAAGLGTGVVCVIRSRPAEIEVVAIPKIGLDDPPATDELATGGRSHVGAAISLGSRARL